MNIDDLDWPPHEQLARDQGFASYYDATEALANRFGYDDYEDFYTDITLSPEAFYTEMTDDELALWQD